MSCKHLFLFIAAVVVTAACSKTSSDAPVAPVSIPDQPVLNQPASQPLSMDEYNTFRNFVGGQQNLASFSPQDYVWDNANKSSLSADQQKLLASITTNCQTPEVKKEPDSNQPVSVGSVLTTTKSRKIQGGAACPVSYALDEAINLKILAASEQVAALSGDVTHTETLNLTDWSLAPVVGTTQTSVTTTGSIAFLKNPQEFRMRLSLTDHQTLSASAAANQPGHSEEVGADIILIQKQDGTTTLGVAMNVTINVPNLTKPVVISFLASLTGSQGGNSTINAAEFYVNHTAVPQADAQSILTSRLVMSILNKMVSQAENSTARLQMLAPATE
jgi:hypothetical protein